MDPVVDTTVATVFTTVATVFFDTPDDGMTNNKLADQVSAIYKKGLIISMRGNQHDQRRNVDQHTSYRNAQRV